MKIAIVRGDFCNPWELQNFWPLAQSEELTVFTGLKPISNLNLPDNVKQLSLFSPVDLNLGTISKTRMAILNRLFIDAHLLFGLENKLAGFDVAHCAETYYGFTNQCVRAKKNKKVKFLVSTVWENIPFSNEGIRGRKKYKHEALKFIDKFLAVTNGARDALIQEGCQPNKIDILQPGVDLEHFHEQSIKSFMGVKRNNNHKLLFVGRLEQDKGLLQFVLDYGSIFKKYMNLELVVVGMGSQKGLLQELVKEKFSGQIHILGAVNYQDMPKVYSICDTLLHPVIGSKSWVEQYGMVLIEAMACGLPIIGTNVGSVPEVVGEAGIITEWGDLGVTAEELINNNLKHEQLSVMALARAQKFFDRKVYAKKLEQVYENLLAGK